MRWIRGDTSWTTVHSYTDGHSLTGNGHGIKALAVDRNDVVFASGTAGSWIVLASYDQGNSWVTKDSCTAGGTSSAIGLAIDSAGRIYAAGFDTQPSSLWRWIVRRSTDDGGSWSTVDTYSFAANYFAYPRGIAVDSSGDVFVVGFEGEYYLGWFYPPSRWIVRKGAQNGTQWSTVDAGTSLFNAHAAGAVAVNSDGEIFVAGYGENGWKVRRSSNGGTSWMEDDEFRGGWGPAGATAANGKVYVTGSSSGWTTRIWNP
ncbi:MAG: hypothetical protein AB7G93_06385 [Bdellovibrionales bacterium]